MVKLGGEIERSVDVLTFSFPAVIVPYEYPRLSWYWLSPANDAVILTDIGVVTLSAVYVTEACPEEFVVVLPRYIGRVATLSLSCQRILLQSMVLPASGMFEAFFSVAVRVMDLPL